MQDLVLDQVRIDLGGRTVLSEVSIAIERGEFIGVLGPNGAGKTTLMRAVLGLVPCVAGRISVLGGPVRRGHPGIGYMPQFHSGAGSLRFNGRDFVASVVRGARWGLPRLDAEGRREVDRALELVGAEALGRRPLAELSGGERQRLLLAQALIGQPKLLLLDEPLISLDVHRQRAVVELVGRLRRDLGITVLFTAHELNPLIGEIDRVLYLGGGQAALGTVDEVITTPVLSRLYGAPIEVVRLDGRIFVMAGDHHIERDGHRHDHDHGHRHDVAV